jgi:hypothetical protein
MHQFDLGRKYITCWCWCWIPNQDHALGHELCGPWECIDLGCCIRWLSVTTFVMDYYKFLMPIVVEDLKVDNSQLVDNENLFRTFDDKCNRNETWLMARKLDMFRHYHVNVENYKCVFNSVGHITTQIPIQLMF